MHHQNNGDGGVAARTRSARLLATAAVLLAVCQTGFAWQNLLQDPGFERYHYDAGQGRYVPDANAAWREYGFGQGSVRLNQSSWTAPAEMVAERPLGFTPGTAGFEGFGANQNKGVLGWEQDVVDAAALYSGSQYEAWIWLGASGADDDTGPDYKDEYGGWTIFFYNNTNTATWTDANALERHGASFDFYGAPNSFVRLSGFGKIPSGAVGFRMRVVGGTWGNASGGANYDTSIAIDNAHFAVMKVSNLLLNGNFEQDVTIAEFKHWQRPADWPFLKNGQIPLIIGDVYGDKFDHGSFRPYWGGSRAYGYGVYVYGAWIDDAFSFSQVASYDAPPGTPLTFMFYWLQNCAIPGLRYQMRDHGGQIGAVIEYLDSSLQRINHEQFVVNWPVASNPANRCAYDHNGGLAYNPRFRLIPPAGTARIRVNINVMTHLVYAPELSHQQYAVDEFYLGYEDEVDAISQARIQQITRTTAMVRWATNKSLASAVDYGITTSYGQTVENLAPVLEHQVMLANLTPGRTYYVRLRSGTAVYPRPTEPETLIFTTQGIGDTDLDGDVDQSDFGVFQQCYSGFGVAAAQACRIVDLDNDTDVDVNDFGLFQGCLSGAGIPADPHCAD